MLTTSPTLPYQNPDLPLESRLQDLLERLTLAEKMSQLCYQAQAIPRLGIPAYNFWNEALHGVARNGRATVFPQAIGLAATWDLRLVQAVANAISDEARAKHHAAALRRSGFSAIYQGLTFWSPNINIFRDPRWGRGQETWGEDPFLTGEMGAAFVRGMQGNHPRYLKTAACAKHFAVHSGPEKERHTFDANPSAQDLHDTYLPAFQKLVQEAKVEAVMGAYNRLYGEPCCGSQFLLQTLLRDDWKFEGHVVSDCGAISDFHNHHHLTHTPAESAAFALRAGCDLACDQAYEAIPEALEQGLLTAADIDQALTRTLRTRFKLGMFDPPELVPYAQIPMSVVGSPQHRQLAYRAAVNSMVLLKNKANILPIAPSVRSILVVGPNAASIDVLLGNYYGLSQNLTTLLHGLLAVAPEGVSIEYRPGCLLNEERLQTYDWSETLASEVDLVIACLGISPQMEGEEGEAVLTRANGDRNEINLPVNQLNYLKRIAAAGTPIVLLLNAGSPLVLGEAAELADAILYAWYPGQEGGRAAADILFGNASPGGRLPLTFPKSIQDLPPFDDYAMTGRTYRYSEKEPAYPFGFGLSYTQFTYSILRAVPPQRKTGQEISCTIRLKNSGQRAGREIVQVYLQDVQASARVPRWKLVAFRPVDLQPGQEKTLRFRLSPQDLAFIDEGGQSRLEEGAFRLLVGGCSPDARLSAADFVEMSFNLVKSTQPARRG